MKWSVSLSSRAEAEFLAFRDPLRLRLARTIANLEENPFPPGTKKLVDYERTYRVHVAKDYRIVYYVDPPAREIVITFVGHKTDRAYKKL
jgi:mRNA-degrading endonuclease RelE of RelBE toxin-antitoxin system